LILSKDNVSLLEAVGSVESVYSADLDLVELLACISDLVLVCLVVNNEHKSVVILNGLDCAFRTERILNNAVLVPGALSFITMDLNFGRSGLRGCRFMTEGNLVPHF